MTNKRSYNALFTLLSIFILAIGGFAQGKHGGDDKRGGDDGNKHENRGGDQERQRGNENHGDRGEEGNRGNGKGWGRQKGDDDQQRVYQQQQRQQNDWARHQQQQNEAYARQQEQAARRQQQYQYDDRGDRGKHKGWKDDGPRGNAYGLRGIWPGEFRGWRDEDKQNRKEAKRDQRRNAYYYSDPIAGYYPVYQQPNYRNNNGYNTRPTRETIVRSIISSFFAPEPTYYNNYYTAPAYRGYAPAYNGYQQNPYYGGNSTQYYSQASYSPAYGYNQRYDPYAASPMYGSQLFGGGGLKSSLLNIGLSMLQGFLGQGYQQGLNQGQYVRQNYGTRSNNYYDPYAASEPAYYSPVASSFANQRQLLEEGYRLGYQDAMMNRDPYGTSLGGANNVDMISEFLANTLMNRI